MQAQQLNEKQTRTARHRGVELIGSDVTDEQARWRDDAIMRSNSTSLVERRVRMALGTGDRKGLNTARVCRWKAKEKDEWRYWQADLLMGRDAMTKPKDPPRADAAAKASTDGGRAAVWVRSTPSALIKRRVTPARR